MHRFRAWCILATEGSQGAEVERVGVGNCVRRLERRAGARTSKALLLWSLDLLPRQWGAMERL